MNGQVPAWTVPLILLALALVVASFAVYGTRRVLAWIFMAAALVIMFGGGWLVSR